MVHSWLKSRFVPWGWLLCSAVLVKTPAWGKGVQSKDAVHGGLSCKTNFGRAHPLPKVGRCTPLDITHQLTEDFILHCRSYFSIKLIIIWNLSGMSFFLEEEVTRSFLMLKNVASFSKNIWTVWLKLVQENSASGRHLVWKVSARTAVLAKL